METLGFVLQQQAFLETLTLDVLKSTEIEGEFLNVEQVRSSLARHLGMDIVGLVPSVYSCESGSSSILVKDYYSYKIVDA